MSHDLPDPPRRPAADPAADLDADLIEALQRSRVLQDAPEAVIQRAIDVFVARPRQAPAAAPAGGLRRLVAVLGFDSAALTPQAAGLRSAGDHGRQMLFSLDDRDIDLRIRAGAGGWQVSGQVLGPDRAGQIELHSGAFRAEQAWNELSEFTVDGVPPGPCRIVLRGESWETELPGIDVPGFPA